MADNAWKRLERDVGKHFGTGRNVRRGMDFSLEDTDVDVWDDQGNHALIIDCKYGKRAKGLIATFKRHASSSPDKTGLKPIMLVVFEKVPYWVCRLADFPTTGDPITLLDEGLWEVWPGSHVMRTNAKYMNEWFNKLDEVYRPQKAEEFDILEANITTAVVVRDKSSKETLIVWER